MNKSEFRKAKIPEGEMVPTSRSDIEESLDGGQMMDAQEIARGLVVKSMQTIAAAQEDIGEEGGPSWPVALSAAKHTIEIAEGRPAQKQPTSIDASIQIVINQYSSPEQREKIIETGIRVSDETRDIIEARAKEIGVE